MTAGEIRPFRVQSDRLPAAPHAQDLRIVDPRIGQLVRGAARLYLAVRLSAQLPRASA